ncbi:hypothetical protein SELMODRAFT_406588 [Selaginella moellendorffii]|uniref:Timeless N-terminal domain-containing protein n=1 Tax=Selaginella moellendorffii TaxID=88036 RepID=D8R0U2_SELML|nr:hypothetical protein SELMODRAFT_406588 [Selaginella moellendorffii]
MEDEAASSPPRGDDAEKKATRKNAAAPVLVYAPWSQGARKQDEEIQKKLETTDERRLASIVSGIGAFETSGSDDWHQGSEVFVKGSHCLEKLRELQRCLTRDNPDSRRVFMQLGQWNVAGKYLVPIIQHYSEDRHLFLASLKVSILLTLPIDQNSTNTFDQVEYLCQIKEEFRERNVLGAIIAHLEEPLRHLEKGSVSEDDWRLLQLVLAFIQNLLAVPEAMNWVGPYPAERYSQLRDGILESLFRECGPDIVLAVTKYLPAFKNGIRKDNFLIIQILHHMFWGQKPELLFQASRKDGTRKMVLTSPFQAADETSKKCPQVEEPEEKFARDINVPLPSRDDISVSLKDYADQFLETGAYNILVQTFQEDVERERREIETSDFVTFYEVAEFFLSYQRYKLLKTLADESALSDSVCGHVSCTMNEETFQMVVSKWHDYTEAAKSPNDWIPVVAVVSLLKEMIHILDLVLKKRSNFSNRDVRTARTLTYKVFYDQTERGILNTCCRSIKAFNNYKQPRRYLENMVEITHVALKLMENTIQEDGALRVVQKARNKASRKKQDDSKDLSDAGPESIEASKASLEENNDILRGDQEQAGGDQEQAGGDKEQAQAEPLLDDLQDDHDNVSTREGTFNVLKCVNTFADSTTVSNYCWLLTFYQSNSPALNYYIVCMLHRICKDCELEPLLYEISILETFETILLDEKLQKLEEYKFLISFINKVVRNFFKKLKSNPWLYVDVLFTRSRESSRDIADDYEFEGDTSITCLADALQEEADDGFVNLASESTSIIGERGVAHRTVPVPKKRRRGPFNEEDEKRIIELFQQFKHKRSCSKLIAGALDSDGKISSAQVTRKLKQLGLHRNGTTPSHIHADGTSPIDADRNDDMEDDELDKGNHDGVQPLNEWEDGESSEDNQGWTESEEDDDEGDLEKGDTENRTLPAANNADYVEENRLPSDAEVDLQEVLDVPPGHPVNRKKRLVKHQTADDASQDMMDLEDLAGTEAEAIPKPAKRRAFTITDDDD